MRHALFPRQLQRMVVRIYVSDIRLHGRERVSFEFTATGRVHEEVGCARVRLSGRGAAGAGVVILRFQDVKASRSDVRRAQQNARRQLTLDGQVPLVNHWHVIRAARVVRHRDLIKRRTVRKVCRCGKRAGKGRVGSSLRPVAVQSCLRRCFCTQRVAERTGRRRRSGGAGADRGKYELRAEGPFIHVTIAQHAHGARVVKNARPTTEARLAVTEHIVGKAHARCESLQVGIESVLGHTRIARNAVLAGKQYAWRRIGVHLRGNVCCHGDKIDLRPAIPCIPPGQGRLIA